MGKILGVGLSIVDHILLVPEFPGKEGYIRCQDYQIQGGGMVGTAMSAAARLGGCVEIWCRVGDDRDGAYALEDLAECGIDISQCRKEPEGKTGVSTVLVKESNGERTFIYRPAAHGAYPAPLPDVARVEDASIVLVDGHWRDAALAAMKRARACGIPVVADLNDHVACPDELLALTDVPVLPAFAASHLCGVADPEAAVTRLGERGARLAVITQGSAGGVYWHKGKTYRYSAFDSPIVDTTGAGDCFHGAFCYAIAAGYSPHDSVRFASAAGVLNCRKLGGRAGLPTYEEVENLLRK